MKRDNFKKKFLIYFCSILVIIGFIGILKIEANGIKTIKQKIEDAKKIGEIENLYKKGDEKSISKLSVFLEDESRGIRRITSRRLVLLRDERAIKYLRGAKAEDVKEMSKIANILIKLNNKTQKEIYEEVSTLVENEIQLYESKVKALDSIERKEDKEEIFNFLRKHRLRNLGSEAIYIFCEQGWIDYLLSEAKKYPRLATIAKNHPEVTYVKIREKTDKLPLEERRKKLINLLVDWQTVFEYEAAIRLLAEMGNKIIPDVLELLDNPANIPTKIPPPFKKPHTTYHIILTVLKTVPDNRSLDRLNKLASDKNSFISEKAKETLEWIKSGVPYPFQYERILSASEDDIYPGRE